MRSVDLQDALAGCAQYHQWKTGFTGNLVIIQWSGDGGCGIFVPLLRESGRAGDFHIHLVICRLDALKTSILYDS